MELVNFRADGMVYMWGLNTVGQLGLGDATVGTTAHPRGLRTVSVGLEREVWSR